MGNIISKAPSQPKGGPAVSGSTGQSGQTPPRVSTLAPRPAEAGHPHSAPLGTAGPAPQQTGSVPANLRDGSQPGGAREAGKGGKLLAPSGTNDPHFICYVDGILRSIPFQEAHQRLWGSNLGWVVPLRWYRWRLGKTEDLFFFGDRKIKKAAEAFAFGLHGRRYSPITVEEVLGKEHDAFVNPRNTMTARASRFGNAAFKKLESRYDALLPYEPVDTPTPKGHQRYGYQMKRGITWLVIIHLDCVDEVNALNFDWMRFLVPPGRKAHPETGG